MNFILKRKKDYSEKRHTVGASDNFGLNSFVAQFFVFHGEKYLGWDCFDKSRVKVGKSHEADLVLSDDTIADVQAEFVIKGNRIIVSDENGNGALLVNDKAVSNCIIGPFDFIKIGNYTLKIKLKKIESPESGYAAPGQETEMPEQDPIARRKGLTLTGEIELPDKKTEAKINAPKKKQTTSKKTAEPVAEETLEFVDIEEVVNEPKAESVQVIDEIKTAAVVDDDIEVEVFEIDPFGDEELKPVETFDSETEKRVTTTEVEEPEFEFDFEGIISDETESRVETTEVEEPDFEFNFEGIISDETDTVLTTESSSDEDESWYLPDSDDDTMTWDAFVNTLPVGSEEAARPEKAVKVDKKEKRQDVIAANSEKTVKVKKQKPAEQIVESVEEKPVRKKLKAKPKAEQASPAPKKEVNSFPASFFNPVIDEEDEAEEEDDFPADFSLREMLVGAEKTKGKAFTGEKVLEVIKFRGDNVLEINHVKSDENFTIIDEGKRFCQVENSDKDGKNLVFSKPLLGKINISNGKELTAHKKKTVKGVLTRQSTFASLIPSSGETLVSDGYYDYMFRQTFVTAPPVLVEDTKEVLPLHKRVVKSNGFKYAMWAVAFHVILMIILPLSVTIVDPDSMTNPETHFVVIETKNIHKPEKPKPKPRPKPVAPAPKPVKPEKKVAVKKKPPEKTNRVASLRKKNIKPKKSGAPKAGGGHKGNLVNRNVNQVGLLGTLGMKTGIDVKPTAALASVTNMDAVTSTHSREARIKVGGLVGNLGDGRMAIPTGGVINTKGSTGVLRSAGIGGKGTVASLQSGKTGSRDVVGSVAAPLTKKVKVKGGGMSMQAVKKVIDEHMDEIQYCYESALIGNPSLMGKAVFEWKILSSGRVGEVKIRTSSIRSSEIHSCIKAAIKTWQFPKPKGGGAVMVSYPFVFDVTGF